MLEHALKSKLTKIFHLESIMETLGWDQRTQMPVEAGVARGEHLATLSGIHYAHIADLELKKIVENYIDLESGRFKANDLSAREKRLLVLLRKDLNRAHRLDREFVERFAALCSESEQTWEQAKKNSDWSRFQPMLEKVLEMKREEARRLGFEKNPYDGWIQNFASDLTAADLEGWFRDVKALQLPLISKIVASTDPAADKIFYGDWPAELQLALSREMAVGIGFNFRRGRMDLSVHPFTSEIHPYDVRITTRLNPRCFTDCLFSVIHEAGHALYDQGLPVEDYGSPLGAAAGMAVHESQSFFWERMVGHSRAFWEYWYPKLKERFPGPLAGVSLERFMKAITAVKKSLIRTEADEVTYNLHILLRFELEMGLARKEIEVRDLPGLWNEKMREYFGVVPQNHGEGVLQDVHWSSGYFGYFPCYALGLILASQLFRRAREDIADFSGELAKGKADHIVQWLRERIHRWGNQKSFHDLVGDATGSKLSVSSFVDHLRERYLS